MHILADSSTTRTEWVIVDGAKVIEHAVTSGLNPFFMSRREISHVIRLELPEAFFHRRWEHVYFYGAGCANPDKIKIVASSLIAQFKTPITVMSDLLGAARGMLIDNSGLVAILSTGANSCFYDGKDITRNVKSGGYLLGDEGSNSYLGKLLVSDVLKNIAPAEIVNKFYKHFETDADALLNNVYSNKANISNILADYSTFLADNIDYHYCRELVYGAFIKFFRRNLSFYDYKAFPVSFVGSTGIRYKDLLIAAARDFGIHINKIEPSSLPGLIEYHSISR